ncbi:MAG TPA: hypothetical protein VGC86_03260 [Afipia sp.]
MPEFHLDFQATFGLFQAQLIGMDMMGETAKAGFQAPWQMPVGNMPARNATLHALRLAVAALGATLILSGAAHAGDDDDEQPETTFEQGFMQNLMKGLSGDGMDGSSIEYRERSPLVVPPKLSLPPPAPKKTQMGGNWPKDPDEQARREAIAASKEGPADPLTAGRVLMPSEYAMRKPKGSSKATGEKVEAAAPYENFILSPSQLGYNGGIMSGMFGKKEEKTTFKQEPKREALTQPPAGYQTPSPNYNYGTGQSNAKTQDYYNPVTDKGTLQR